MSNFFLYAGYGLSRKKSKLAYLMWALPDFPRPLGEGKGEGAKILGLALLLSLFLAGLTPKSHCEQERFSARRRHHFGRPRKDVSSKSMESRTSK
jgi:hypothetical protein